MNDQEYLDYLVDIFDKENQLEKVILIGKNNAIRLLVMSGEKWKEDQD